MSFFQTTEIPSNAMSGYYNYYIVILSYVIATLASFVALEISAYLRKGLSKTVYWPLLGGSFAMGAGIFTMHFVGMLAFIMPMPMSFGLLLTFASILVAIGASALALYVVSKPVLTWPRLVLGGIVIGIAIAGMHYIGMTAMLGVKITYLPSLFTLSIAIAIGASMAAIWCMFQCDKGTSLRKKIFKIGSALIMGAAIAGMHYVGMAAAIFVPMDHGSTLDATAFILSPGKLAFLLSCIAALIMFIGLYAVGRQQSLLVKLFFGFLIVLFMIVPLAFTSLENIKALTNSFTSITNTAFPRIMALLEMKSVSSRIGEEIAKSDRTIEDDGETRNEILEEELNKLQSFEETYAKKSVENNALTIELNGLIGSIKKNTQKFIEFEQKKVSAEELQSIKDELQKTEDSLYAFIDKQITLEKKHLDQLVKNALGTKNQSIILTILMIITIAIIALFLSFFISFKITKPIIHLRDVSQAIANGDLKTRANVQSEDEIGQLAASFNAMVSELDAAHKKRDEFVGMAAHDLRIPVSVINEGSNLLYTEALGPLNPKQSRISQMITNASSSMIILLDELLAVNVVQAKVIQIQPKKVNLIEFVENIYSFNQLMSEKKHIDLKLDNLTNETFAYFDENKISQVINNFVSNAIKFSKPNSKVQMTFSKVGENLRVEVKDEAGGVPEKEQTQLFTWFAKISVKPTAGEASHGLGLAICKDIIQAHGGNIGYAKNGDKGSIFFFEIRAFEKPAT